jgi:hypothetical protein
MKAYSFHSVPIYMFDMGCTFEARRHCVGPACSTAVADFSVTVSSNEAQHILI